MGLTVVGPLAFAIGVMEDRREAGPLPSRRPLQQLEVAVRIAEGQDGPTTDGTESGPPSRVARLTKSTMALLAAPSFQEGSGSG